MIDICKPENSTDKELNVVATSTLLDPYPADPFVFVGASIRMCSNGSRQSHFNSYSIEAVGPTVWFEGECCIEQA